MRIVIFSFLLFNCVAVKAQTNPELAHQKGEEAVELMDHGKIAQGLALLEEAQKLDPSKSIYSYEMGYGNYAAGNYKKAIKILEGILHANDSNDQYYQLLGNAYDDNGDPKKAEKIYAEGLSKYPNSGKIYLETGLVKMHRKEYNDALMLFEKGLSVEPDFPSNYYWAAKLFLTGSDEEVWGMIYGEIFMNLERNSKRTAEMSKLLFDTYKSQMKFNGDTSLSVSFSKSASIVLTDTSDYKKMRLPFGVGIYEPAISIAMVSEKSIDINSLNRIRTRFLKIYYDRKFDNDYPNVLFDYQKRVDAAGHLEAYNHWILMKGDESGFDNWYNSNKEKWENFMAWFSKNQLEITATNRFARSQYQ